MATNQELIDRVEAALDGAMKTPVNSDRHLNEVFQEYVQTVAHSWPEIKAALERGDLQQNKGPSP